MALENPAATEPSRDPGPCAMPAARGTTATPIRPARRAAALFTPEAMPAKRLSTAESTVVVNGATVSERPSPNTTTPGRTPARYDDPVEIPESNTKPAAATNGPKVMG